MELTPSTQDTPTLWSERRVFVLSGEGIECERESAEFFKWVFSEDNVEIYSLYSLFSDPESFFQKCQSGDWVFFPGGFSFADHFGAGKLLAYRLKEILFFDKMIARSLHGMGVCNGFQVLTEAGIFGEKTHLLANQKPSEKKSFPFTNRWVRFSSPLIEEKGLRWDIPVRHGEGRLQVNAFLHYEDDSFDNGSYEQVAGVYRKIENSTFWGLMPHPEIAAFKMNHPNCLGPERMPRFRHEFLTEEGDGKKLMQEILKVVYEQKGNF